MMQYRFAGVGLLAALAMSAQIPDFRPPTPLFAAVMKNDLAGTKKLLEEGADPNQGNFFGRTPLMIAITNSNWPLSHLLLDRGADAKSKDGAGATTLMWAVASDSPDRTMIEALIKGGVDPNAQNQLGESALTWATRRGNQATIEQLKSAGATDTAWIRQSVEKAVALLQKSAPQFVKVSGCVSCHHQSLPQMAYSAARERGFKVDEAAAEYQVKAVMGMVRPITKGLQDGAIVLPNPGISVSYLLLGLAAEGYPADETTAAMALAITRTQMPDGSLNVLTARPPMENSPFTSAALSIRALQYYGKGYHDVIAKARQWLQQAKPITQEDRSMRLLGLAWSKADLREIAQAATELLAQQRPDGGWAQLDGIETDAYATGQALYALHESGLAAEDKAYQRGVTYLMRTQLEDGSWRVRTRSSPFQPLKDSGFPHGRDQWISAAGTSWASLALALTQPKVPQHAKGQSATVTSAAKH